MKERVTVATKRLLSVGLFLAFLLTASGAFANSALLDRTLSLSSLAQTLKTPEAIANYMWKNFAFEKDRHLFGTGDYWQKPEQFASFKKGDCEDFALFAREMLKRNGIPAFLLNIYGNKYAHTICVFERGGHYQYISGSKLIETDAKDLKSIMTEIYPNWKSGAIVTATPASTRGRILERITR